MFLSKKIIAALIFLLIVLGSVSYLVYQKYKPVKHVHFHAGFQVYVDGKQVDFSSEKYMHTEPCVLNGKDVTGSGDEQEEKAHLHDHVGDVVHVHREKATWGDLFTNIHYSIPLPYEAYLNGQKVSDILSKQIHPYDSLVILIGKHGPVTEYLKHAVTKEHIVKTERKSESCGS